jgi:hypothetical protein
MAVIDLGMNKFELSLESHTSEHYSKTIVHGTQGVLQWGRDVAWENTIHSCEIANVNASKWDMTCSELGHEMT